MHEKIISTIQEILKPKKPLVAIKAWKEIPENIPAYEDKAFPGTCTLVGEVIETGKTFYFQTQNVYCTGRKDRAHPMATGIAETYGADEGEVMNMFCNGFSIGEIMLALQTQQMNGTPAEDSLAQRQNGQGWGQIWREAGLIGNAEHGTPPGQADKPVNPGHGGTPPGQDKRNNPQGGDDDDSGD